MVQVGNEIIGGMLYPDGRMRDQESTNLGRLVKAGIQGTKEGLRGRKVPIMIHIDRGGDQDATRWFFDNMAKEKVEFDIIGQSYYPFWHGDLKALAANLKMTAERYKKPIIVVETAYAFTLARKDGPSNFVNEEKQLLFGYPATPAGQASFLRDIRRTVAETPNGLGMGVVYWAPEYISDPGIKDNPYENLTLWDFDNRLIEPAADALFKPEARR
jgi:arabinogalactan endo-1,4-beta-galactosidase